MAEDGREEAQVRLRDRLAAQEARVGEDGVEALEAPEVRDVRALVRVLEAREARLVRAVADVRVNPRVQLVDARAEGLGVEVDVRPSPDWEEAGWVGGMDRSSPGNGGRGPPLSRGLSAVANMRMISADSLLTSAEPVSAFVPGPPAAASAPARLSMSRGHD